MYAKRGRAVHWFSVCRLDDDGAGAEVLEFNARLGDPETQVLMHRMESDFVESLFAAAHGALDQEPLRWRPEPSVCVVLAAAGYPGSVRTGDAITGINQVQHATVFDAGTKLTGNELVTSGGRVLGVTARGEPCGSDSEYLCGRPAHPF